LNTEADTPFSDISVEKPKPKKEGKTRQGNDKYACTALAWNATGRKLFAAFSDNIIRVYHVGVEAQWETSSSWYCEFLCNAVFVNKSIHNIIYLSWKSWVLEIIPKLLRL